MGEQFLRGPPGGNAKLTQMRAESEAVGHWCCHMSHGVVMVT